LIDLGAEKKSKAQRSWQFIHSIKLLWRPTDDTDPEIGHLPTFVYLLA